jgi:DNA-directed RNA polymerase specialized sigma24 family protein
VTVDEREWLAERWQAHAPHPRAVAYRMLGLLSEADDAVQEAWLRLNRADTSGIAKSSPTPRACGGSTRPCSATDRRRLRHGQHLPAPFGRCRHDDLPLDAIGNHPPSCRQRATGELRMMAARATLSAARNRVLDTTRQVT